MQAKNEEQMRPHSEGYKHGKITNHSRKPRHRQRKCVAS